MSDVRVLPSRLREIQPRYRVNEIDDMLERVPAGQEADTDLVMLRDAASALEAHDAGIATLRAGWRTLLVEADSMLSAAGYGRAVSKDEMIALSAKIRRAYEGQPDAPRSTLCERCGGTGQQYPGLWNMETQAYDTMAGPCVNCHATGWLRQPDAPRERPTP